MPNTYDYQIPATWTMNKGAWLVKGHAREIEPGNLVTVISRDPGRNGSRLSLVTIGQVEELGPDEYTGEPMRIGRFVRT